MTNQSQQPLTLKLSNGQEVSVPTGKSVLQFTENGQSRSCAIVRGPNGVAIYNAEGDIQINGAPSSAHWLQPGDQLRFGDSMTASVHQLGAASAALDSLLNENTQPEAPTTAPVQEAIQTPVTNEQNSFTPATAAMDLAVPQAVTPTTPVDNTQDITPATAATTIATESVAPEVSSPDAPSAMDLAIPAATGAAALAASAMSIAGDFEGEPTTPDSPSVPATESGVNSITSALESAAASTPSVANEAPVTEATSTQPEISGFAADLLARIQADNNENETVGTTASETTHSPLAADGPSFSSPAPDAASDGSSSIGNLLPELAQTSAPAPVAETEPTAEAEVPHHVETTTADSTERQTQSSSVSDLLERMKAEGKWDDGVEATNEVDTTSPEQTSPEQPATEQPATEQAAAPAFAEADDDVQNYMSQLLSRMRDPNAAPQETAATAATPTPEHQQPVQETVEQPKAVGLLKPEEFVPKNKAKRLDSLQEMRALANTQARTAIDRSQAKRVEAVNDVFTLAIAIASCITAACVFFFNVFGDMSFVVGMITMIAGAFFCCKTYFSDLVETKKDEKKQIAAQEAAQEPAQAVQEAQEAV